MCPIFSFIHFLSTQTQVDLYPRTQVDLVKSFPTNNWSQKSAKTIPTQAYLVSYLYPIGRRTRPALESVDSCWKRSWSMFDNRCVVLINLEKFQWEPQFVLVDEVDARQTNTFAKNHLKVLSVRYFYETQRVSWVVRKLFQRRPWVERFSWELFIILVCGSKSSNQFQNNPDERLEFRRSSVQLAPSTAC